MRAAVYRGKDEVRVESVPVPEVGHGEALIRVHVCGVCPTDLKKIHDGRLEGPRVFGHETAGIIEALGGGVRDWQVGDRVALHHHVPCRSCFYCDRKFYSQCARFKETGTTAGYIPSGGGFSEYVLARDWIVEGGMIPIPDNFSFEEAAFVEPVNCCLKAVTLARARAGVALVFGQGAMGLLLDQLLHIDSTQVLAIDPIAERRRHAEDSGAIGLDPYRDDLVGAAHSRTNGRGADAAILATDHPSALAQALEATRPGGRIVLFAATQIGKPVPVDVGNLCVLDKRLVGSYSASYDLQEQSAEMLFSHRVRVGSLISHRLPLEEIQLAIEYASNPTDDSLKIVVLPG